jgi:hypothetical protein
MDRRGKLLLAGRFELQTCESHTANDVMVLHSQRRITNSALIYRTYGLTRPPPGLAAWRYIGNCTSARSSVSFAAADEPVAEAGRGRNGDAASHGLA